MVGLTFCTKEYKRGEGWIGFRPFGELTIDNVWETVSSIYQFNSCKLNIEAFCLGQSSVKMPMGQAWD